MSTNRERLRKRALLDLVRILIKAGVQAEKLSEGPIGDVLEGKNLSFKDFNKHIDLVVKWRDLSLKDGSLEKGSFEDMLVLGHGLLSKAVLEIGMLTRSNSIFCQALQRILTKGSRYMALDDDIIDLLKEAGDIDQDLVDLTVDQTLEDLEDQS